MKKKQKTLETNPKSEEVINFSSHIFVYFSISMATSFTRIVNVLFSRILLPVSEPTRFGDILEQIFFFWYILEPVRFHTEMENLLPTLP